MRSMKTPIWAPDTDWVAGDLGIALDGLVVLTISGGLGIHTYVLVRV